MDLIDFAAYKAETDAKKKNRLREKIVRANLPLVRKLVMKIQRRNSVAWMWDADDLFQAGAIGLLSALDRFDPSRAKFSTFAAFWIRHEVQKAMEVQGVIRRPRGSTLNYRAYREMEKIQTLHGRPATLEELNAVAPKPLTQKDVDVSTPMHLVSIDSDVNATVGNRLNGRHPEKHGNSDNTFHDHHSSEDPGPEKLLEDAQAKAILAEVLESLKPRERRVIEGLFYNDRSYEQIAKEEQVSAEYVRQVRASALEKLRAVLLDVAEVEAEDSKPSATA